MLPSLHYLPSLWLEALKKSSNMEQGFVVAQDSQTLALLGKKQILRRRFTFLSLFAFAVNELITWETVLALFVEGLKNGGPAGLVYGFLLSWLSTLYVSSFFLVRLLLATESYYVPSSILSLL